MWKISKKEIPALPIAEDIRTAFIYILRAVIIIESRKNVRGEIFWKLERRIQRDPNKNLALAIS
jgi:hypothetical protein